jgi:hypothetical protein
MMGLDALAQDLENHYRRMAVGGRDILLDEYRGTAGMMGGA